MQATMDRCRNCGAANLRELGFVGALAPFFLKRVLNVELVTRTSSHRLKRLLQKLTAFARPMLARIHPTIAALELQSCLDCSFVQTKAPFTDEAIGRLYSDYRSNSYNAERCHYEPSYAAIANKVGQYQSGGFDRIDSLTEWLQGKVDLRGKSMLDYGGADGQFLPAFEGDKYVFEVSNIEPARGVVRISDESLLRTYSYIQLAHVLEHVTEPLKMVKRVSNHLAEGGFLLVEVPQDLDSALLERLQTGRIDMYLLVHEHINNYCLLSVQKLIAAADLEVIFIEEIQIESPVAKQRYIRALAKRPVGV